MTEKRKYPIAGTDFFTQIMDDDGYYIDKTDVIPWILGRKKRVILFTRPRRFGKSTMLSMLKAFFEYRIDRDGKVVDNRHYFEGLKVAQDADAMALLGAYPVISITLKDVIQHSYEEALGALANKVSIMARQCAWVLEQKKAFEGERQRLVRLIEETASPEELAKSIAFLSAGALSCASGISGSLTTLPTACSPFAFISFSFSTSMSISSSLLIVEYPLIFIFFTISLKSVIFKVSYLSRIKPPKLLFVLSWDYVVI